MSYRWSEIFRVVSSILFYEWNKFSHSTAQCGLYEWPDKFCVVWLIANRKISAIQEVIKTFIVSFVIVKYIHWVFGSGWGWCSHMKFEINQVVVRFNCLIKFFSHVDVRNGVCWTSDNEVQNIAMNVCGVVDLLNIIILEDQVTQVRGKITVCR